MPSPFTFEQKILQGVSLLMTDDDFMADIRTLQKKYHFPAPPEQREKDGNPRHLLDVFEPLKKDVKALREKYILSESYQLAILYLVQEGNMNKCNLRSEIWHLNPYLATTETRGVITLKIYPETSWDDMKANWPRIQRAQGELLAQRKLGRKNRRKNLQRDMGIFSLHKAGMKTQDIAREINARYQTPRLNYEDILNIIARLKKGAHRISPKKT